MDWRKWVRSTGVLVAIMVGAGCGGVEGNESGLEGPALSEQVADQAQGLATTFTFAPVADARVEATSPAQNFGTVDGLYTDNSPQQESYLRFSVTGLSGSVSRAKLRLYVTNGSSDGPALFATAGGWSEGSLTWNTRPVLTGGPLGDLGGVAVGTWVEFDVTAVVQGNGDFHFGLLATATDGVDFHSRESTHATLRPQLVVTTGIGSSDTVLSAVADAYVEEAAPSANRGSATDLQVDGAPLAEAYLSFQVPAPSGTVLKATLRLFAFNGSSDGPALYPLAGPWGEQTVTWNNRPARGTTPVADVGVVPVNAWVEYDVTSVVKSGGTYGFALVPTATDGVDFYSRESANPALRPQLVISTGGGDTCVPGVRTKTFTLAPLDDTQLFESSPDSPGGYYDWLSVNSAPRVETYFRFGFDTLVGRVKSAKLRLYAFDGTSDGPALYKVDPYYLREATTTWSTRPGRYGSPVADLGSVASGSWVELDVTSLVQGNGTYGFGLIPGAGDEFRFWSKESFNPALRPHLQVITESTVTCDSQRVCDGSGSCWFNPMPHGEDMRDTWGSSPSNLWATGPGGTVLHWDGTRWRSVPSSTPDRLSGIWGSSAQNVWAVGARGSIVRFNGTAWLPVRPGSTLQPDLSDVFGTGPSDVWAVGAGGTVLRFNGSQWQPFPSGTSQDLRGVWASSATDVWVVGSGGVVRRWNGTTWTEIFPAGDEEFSMHGVFGFGPNDVWLMGNKSTLRHWNGTAWTTVSYDDEGGWFTAAWGSSPGDVWFVGYGVRHWNGTTLEWAQFEGNAWPEPLIGIWGTSSQDLWAVGWAGSFARRAGQTLWKKVGPVGYGSSGNAAVEALWMGGPEDGWAATDDGLLRWDGAEWTWIEEPGGLRVSFSGVWGSGANDVWATSSWSTVARFDGTRWKYMYWDGQQMKEGHGFFGNYPNGSWIADVWGSGPNNVWFVGTGGFVLRWNGSSWAQLQPPAMSWLNSVHGTGPNNVWAVGNGGTIFHFNGATWTNHTINMANYLNAVWAAGPSDAWAVGSEGTVLRWNGSSWTQVPVPTQATLNDIHGTGPNDVWAVGTQGTLLHWNGSTWTLVRGGTSRDLLGVYTTGTGPVWFSGYKGAILRR